MRRRNVLHRRAGGQSFPGIGALKNNEFVCSRPIARATTSNAPFGYQFVGPYPCQLEASRYCNEASTISSNGNIIPVGAPTGAERYLSIKLTGQNPGINLCFMR